MGLFTPRKNDDCNPLDRSTRSDWPHRRSRHGASHGHVLPSRHRLRAARQHDLHSPDCRACLARPCHLPRVVGKPLARGSVRLRACAPAAWGHRRHRPHQPRADRRPPRARPHARSRSARRCLLRLLLLGGAPPLARVRLGCRHRPSSCLRNRPMATSARRPSWPVRSHRNRRRAGRFAARRWSHWPRHAHRRRRPHRSRRQRRERRSYLLHLRCW